MDIIDQARARGLLFDGAFGSLLMQRGLPSGVNAELWCLEHPAIVSQIHADYLTAGADVITTNTFGASPLKLKKAGLARQTEEINRQMVACAKAVITPESFVAGDIGPTGEMLKPYGLVSFEEVVANYAEQAEYLAQGGVDLFIIETMFDLNEALAAIKGVRQVSTKPIFATLTFEKKATGFATVMGNKVTEAMQSLIDAGAAAVGANCSIGSDKMVVLSGEIRQAVESLVIVQPNAGLPVLHDGILHYPEDPATFAENIRKIKALGVEIVGGCCGTTPEYIQLIRRII